MPNPKTVLRTCETCSLPFSVLLSSIARGGGRYCSRPCYYASNRTSVLRTCQVCGVEFQARAGQVKLGFAKYCSQACFGTTCRSRLVRQCEVCEIEFSVIPAEAEKGKGRFCSKICADRAKIIPVMDRIRAKLVQEDFERVPGLGPCSVWMGGRSKRGYGKTSDNGKHLRVIRVVLSHKLGRSLFTDELAMHLCSYPPCCEEKHLVVGNHLQNMRQRKSEGKYPTGTAHPMARVKREQAASDGHTGYSEPVV